MRGTTGQDGAEGALLRPRAVRRLLLAAALCALAGTAVGCGNSEKAGEEQEVAWKTQAKDEEETAESAGDRTAGAGADGSAKDAAGTGAGESAAGEPAAGAGGAAGDQAGGGTGAAQAAGEGPAGGETSAGAGTAAARTAGVSEYPFTEQVSASQVEDMVKLVRASWTRDREAMEAGRYDKRSESGMDVYENGGEIAMIEVPAGIDGVVYARTFEFEDGKLIFAYYAGEGQEYRLYFRNDSLFRLNMRVNGAETLKDAAYGDADFCWWHQAGLSEGYTMYAAAGGTVPGMAGTGAAAGGTGAVAADGTGAAAAGGTGAVAAGGTGVAAGGTGAAAAGVSGAPVQGADFKFRSSYRDALGNSEAYLISTFGDPDDTYYGDQGEVADTNWYTYQNPYCFFDLRRSKDTVLSLVSNAGTVFELAKSSYTIDEVEAYLGAYNGDTYEGESVEGSFSETGDLVFGCQDKSFYYDFILENGRVTKNSRCEISPKE